LRRIPRGVLNMEKNIIMMRTLNNFDKGKKNCDRVEE
jgi:hypothetical protein